MSAREADIFRFWIEYYGRRVDHVAVVIVSEQGDDTSRLKELCMDAGADFRILKCDHFDQPQSLVALRELASRRPTDWIIHTDSDEFLRQLDEIRSVVEEMAANGADFAPAWMADRLTPTGHLRGIDDLKTYEELEAAFPVRSAVTKHLARACTYKNPVSRAPHIGEIHSPGKHLRCKAKRLLTLEHFKWRQGLEDRLNRWMAHYKTKGLDHGVECRRILNELRRFGRIRVERWRWD